VVGALLVVAAAAVFAIIQLTGNESPTPPARTVAGNSIAQPKSTAAAPSTSARDRARTTIAVLNGTTVQGLARAVADKLQKAGYRIGTVTNAADQQRSATQVAYRPGDLRMARDTARTIHVGGDAVVPIDQVTAATAGSQAEVVVTVGADQTR
jgi:hypothetical protein